MMELITVASPDILADIGEEQTQRYADLVGSGLPPDIIDQLHEFAKDAEPHPFYQPHPLPPSHPFSQGETKHYVYEMLEKTAWKDITLPAVEKWIGTQDNLQRAERSVRRTREQDSEHSGEIRRAFGLFRLKEKLRPRWHSVSEGHGSDEHEPQAVVFIALTDLNPSNGFFMHLRKGQDICIDSNAPIQFPPSGGGLGLFISLNL